MMAERLCSPKSTEEEEEPEEDDETEEDEVELVFAKELSLNTVPFIVPFSKADIALSLMLCDALKIVFDTIIFFTKVHTQRPLYHDLDPTALFRVLQVEVIL